MKEVLLIIPAYNEEASLGGLIQGLSESPICQVADLLVVNDGSYDATGRIAYDMGALVLTHVYNMGYGTALQVGYKYALRHGYKYVLQIDGDAQHDIANLQTMMDIMLSERQPPIDILIGSRFLPGAKSFPISKPRMLVIRIFRWIIKFATGRVITDPTSGLQALSERAFEFYSRFNNFHYEYPDMNMIIQMLLNDFVIEEFPALMHERAAGESMHSALKPVVYLCKMMLGTMIVIIREKMAKRRRRRVGGKG